MGQALLQDIHSAAALLRIHLDQDHPELVIQVAGVEAQEQAVEVTVEVHLVGAVGPHEHPQRGEGPVVGEHRRHGANKCDGQEK